MQRAVSAGNSLSMPGSPAKESGEALRGLGVLHQLCLEAWLASSREELCFRVLNRSVALCGYDRAALFELDGSKPKLLGVSGVSEPGENSLMAEQLCGLTARLQEPGRNRVLAEADFPRDAADEFAAYGAKFANFSVFWVGLHSSGKPRRGLWLERWNGPWLDSELTLISSLGLAYGSAFEKFEPRFKLSDLYAKLAKGKYLGLAGVIILLALFALRLPLRVVAPCEVAALSPFVVTAPLNGAISEVLVEPGQDVSLGQPLFSYDRRVLEEELNIARQQVKIIETSLNRSNLQAFLDPKAKAEISLLELRLTQEKTRLQLAQYNASKAVVLAEAAGRVVIDDPSQWRGRPVNVGEKVLSIVDPGQSKLKIWLALDDYAQFEPNSRVSVSLNAFPESRLAAGLNFVSLSAGVSPQGVPCFLAEASWLEPDPRVRVGLLGSAVLQGERVSLASWLARKPLAWLRRVMGL